MPKASQVVRVRREIQGACEAGLDWVQLSQAVSRQIRRMVQFDAACWHTMDPGTLLLTGNATEDLPEGGLPMLAKCEYSFEDVNKWGFLARQESSVGRLSVATQGQPELSNRFRALLKPVGLGKELRASFVSAGSCWGSAGFYRGQSEPDFTKEEEDFLRSVARKVGLGYRRALVLSLLETEASVEGPGLVILDARNEVLAVSPAAEFWLDSLPLESPGSAELPLPVLALTERVRSQEGDATVQVCSSSGTWLNVHATQLKGDPNGQIGVTLEPVGPPELARLLIQGYGLSEREQEVTYAVLRGESTREIAKALFISPYTVQDHLKSIFEKLGVRSRRELVSRTYSKHILPLVAAGRSPSPNGWFGPGVKPTVVKAKEEP